MNSLIEEFQLQISLTNESDSIGQVYFWDHESANERDAFYLVAESFTDFIGKSGNTLSFMD